MDGVLAMVIHFCALGWKKIKRGRIPDTAHDSEREEDGSGHLPVEEMRLKIVIEMNGDIEGGNTGEKKALFFSHRL